jgi:uncharacterized coiled-coil protein SlyX
MRERLEKRVADLEAEYRTGQEMLAELDAKRADLQQTLLRISGAIQVLRELLGTTPATPADDTGAGQPDPPAPDQDGLRPDSATRSPRLVG